MLEVARYFFVLPIPHGVIRVLATSAIVVVLVFVLKEWLVVVATSLYRFGLSLLVLVFSTFLGILLTDGLNDRE